MTTIIFYTVAALGIIGCLGLYILRLYQRLEKRFEQANNEKNEALTENNTLKKQIFDKNNEKNEALTENNTLKKQIFDKNNEIHSIETELSAAAEQYERCKSAIDFSLDISMPCDSENSIIQDYIIEIQCNYRRISRQLFESIKEIEKYHNMTTRPKGKGGKFVKNDR